MATTMAKRAARKPLIHICESDYDTLANLALRMERGAPELSAALLAEIDRARLHPDHRLPPNVARIGSEIDYVDEKGEGRTVTLVLPQEADISAGRVSVATSVGAGLIGLAEGQAIDWPCPDGRPRTLKVVAVRQPG